MSVGSLLAEVAFNPIKRDIDRKNFTNFTATGIFKAQPDNRQLDLLLNWIPIQQFHFGLGMRYLSQSSSYASSSRIGSLLFLAGIDIQWLRFTYSYDFAITNFVNLQELGLIIRLGGDEDAEQ